MMSVYMLLVVQLVRQLEQQLIVMISIERGLNKLRTTSRRKFCIYVVTNYKSIHLMACV